jgi:uncharacterized oxidoreductase
MIAHNPLHGSGQAGFPHPALALGDDAYASQGIGMTDGRRRQPASDVAPHAIPEDAAVLAAPRKRAMPEPSHLESEEPQRRCVHGHSVMSDVSTHHRLQPLALFGNGFMHAALKLGFHLIQLGLLRRCPGEQLRMTQGRCGSLIHIRMTSAFTTPRRFNRRTGENLMKINGNTILITGGGSGIGRGLAEAFHAKGNQVVIAGRRKNLLDETVAANPGMKAAVLDIENSETIRTFAEKLKKDFPTLNVVIHNAGIMKPESLKDGAVADAEAMVTTNLLGPIRLNAALLPFLLKQPNPVIMTVSSGLAFVPLAMTPTYCATKAAIHSYTQSMRYQLNGTTAQVLELIPPYVQTELMGPRMASDPNAMPLKDFISETMGILENSPNRTEICVERVKPLRFAEASGQYDAFFKNFNDGMAAAAVAH